MFPLGRGFGCKYPAWIGAIGKAETFVQSRAEMRFERADRDRAFARGVNAVGAVTTAEVSSWRGQPMAQRRCEIMQDIKQADDPAGAGVVHHVLDCRVNALGAGHIRKQGQRHGDPETAFVERRQQTGAGLIGEIVSWRLWIRRIPDDVHLAELWMVR